MPPACSRTYTWAALNNNILMLRNAQNQIQCFYATQSGTGTSKQITIVTLGGAVYTNNYLLQCDPASYREFRAGWLTVAACMAPLPLAHSPSCCRCARCLSLLQSPSPTS